MADDEMPSQIDRCLTPTSPDEVNEPLQPIGQTQLDDAALYLSMHGALVQVSDSLAGTFDLSDVQEPCLFTQGAANPAAHNIDGQSQDCSSYSNYLLLDPEAPAAAEISSGQVDQGQAAQQATEGEATRQPPSQAEETNTAAAAFEMPDILAEGSPVSSGLDASTQDPRNELDLHTQSTPIMSAFAGFSGTQQSRGDENARPKRVKRTRKTTENDENAAFSDLENEKPPSKRSKRHSMGSKLSSVEEPKAVKRKSSTPLGDITNTKSAKLSGQGSAFTKPSDTVVVGKEALDAGQREQDKANDEVAFVFASPSSMPVPVLVPSPVLALYEQEERQLQTQAPVDENNNNIKIYVNNLLQTTADDITAAQALIALSTPDKPQKTTGRRTIRVYATSNAELRAHGVTLDMFCEEEWNEQFGSPLSKTNPQFLELQEFSVSPLFPNVTPRPFAGLFGSPLAPSFSPIAANPIPASFQQCSALYRPISAQEQEDDDLGLNIVREAPKVHTPPRRRPSEPTQDTTASPEHSEGELEDAPIDVSGLEEEEQKETPIPSEEIQQQLKSTAEELTRKKAQLNADDETNKLQFALYKFHELFTPEELKTGIIPTKGKSRSKTRVMLDAARVQTVKDALAEKFKLDDFYMDILWNNMRPELNRKLAKAPKKPPKAKSTAMKVKLF